MDFGRSGRLGACWGYGVSPVMAKNSRGPESGRPLRCVGRFQFGSPSPTRTRLRPRPRHQWRWYRESARRGHVAGARRALKEGERPRMNPSLRSSRRKEAQTSWWGESLSSPNFPPYPHRGSTESRPTARRLRWFLPFVLVLLSGNLLVAQDDPRWTNKSNDDSRFTTLKVFVDSGSQPLAAYQVSLTLSGSARIVGIEGGESAP